jgi:hypothetical protein
MPFSAVGVLRYIRPVGARPVTKLEPGPAPEPSIEELTQCAHTLERESVTGSLRSTRTVLMALLLCATEALELLPEDPHPEPPSRAFEESVGAVGAYLFHVCSLQQLSLGQLVATRFAEDGADGWSARCR